MESQVSESVAFSISGIVFVIVSLAVLYSLHLLYLPLISISLGIFFIGFAFPELIKKMKYSHTLWLPVGLTIAGIAGYALLFGGDAFKILTSMNWCLKQPCYPLGLPFLFFFFGNLANWLGWYMAGYSWDIIEGGELTSEHKPKKKPTSLKHKSKK